MRKMLVAGLATILATAAVPASAAQVVFSLTGNTSTSGKAGNALTFTATSGDTTVKLEATAWSATKLRGGSYSIAQAYLGDYSYGLGVTAAGDGTGRNNEHTIDNHGTVDFVVLQFDQTVDVSSAVLTAFNVNGSTDNDSTVGIGTTSTAWNVKPSFTSSSQLDALFTESNLYGNGSNSLFNINPGDLTGNILLVAASFDNDHHTDGFKLSSLTVNTVTSAVPEPATWAMMIGGFGLIGGAMRRRRGVKAVAA